VSAYKGMEIRRFALAAGFAVFAAVPMSAQQPDISGSWELSLDGRKVPAARLVSGVTRAVLGDIAAKDARSIRWCLPLGMPFTMGEGHGRPLEIRQGSRYLTIVAESTLAPVRYLYLSRPNHITQEEYEPSPSGDSIARWEGDTLVVDTVGFSGVRGMLAIPGGGYRTETTRLVERYRVVNGNILSVTFTWEDPAVFAAPHTYEYRYQRLPASYEPRAPLPCDAFDPARVAFLEQR
jgi:hypothetical protein